MARGKSSSTSVLLLLLVLVAAASRAAASSPNMTVDNEFKSLPLVHTARFFKALSTEIKAAEARAAVARYDILGDDVPAAPQSALKLEPYSGEAKLQPAGQGLDSAAEEEPVFGVPVKELADQAVETVVVVVNNHTMMPRGTSVEGLQAAEAHGLNHGLSLLGPEAKLVVGNDSWTCPLSGAANASVSRPVDTVVDNETWTCPLDAAISSDGPSCGTTAKLRGAASSLALAGLPLHPVFGNNTTPTSMLWQESPIPSGTQPTTVTVAPPVPSGAFLLFVDLTVVLIVVILIAYGPTVLVKVLTLLLQPVAAAGCGEEADTYMRREWWLDRSPRSFLASDFDKLIPAGWSLEVKMAHYTRLVNNLAQVAKEQDAELDCRAQNIRGAHARLQEWARACKKYVKKKCVGKALPAEGRTLRLQLKKLKAKNRRYELIRRAPLLAARYAAQEAQAAISTINKRAEGLSKTAAALAFVELRLDMEIRDHAYPGAAALQAKLQEERERCHARAPELSALRRELDELDSAAQALDLSNRLQALEAKVAGLKTQANAQKDVIEIQSNELSTLRQTNEHLDMLSVAQSDEIKQLKRKNELVERQNIVANARLSELKDKMDDMDRDAGAKDDEVKRLTQQVEELRQKGDQLKEEMDQTRTQAAKRNMDQEEKIKKIAEERRRAGQRIAEERDRARAESQRELEQAAQARVRAAERERDSAKADATHEAAVAEELRGEVAALCQDVDSARAEARKQEDTAGAARDRAQQLAEDNGQLKAALEAARTEIAKQAETADRTRDVIKDLMAQNERFEAAAKRARDLQRRATAKANDKAKTLAAKVKALKAQLAQQGTATGAAAPSTTLNAAVPPTSSATTARADSSAADGGGMGMPSAAPTASAATTTIDDSSTAQPNASQQAASAAPAPSVTSGGAVRDFSTGPGDLPPSVLSRLGLLTMGGVLAAPSAPHTAPVSTASHAPTSTAVFGGSSGGLASFGFQNSASSRGGGAGPTLSATPSASTATPMDVSTGTSATAGGSSNGVMGFGAMGAAGGGSGNAFNTDSMMQQASGMGQGLPPSFKGAATHGSGSLGGHGASHGEGAPGQGSGSALAPGPAFGTTTQFGITTTSSTAATLGMPAHSPSNAVPNAGPFTGGQGFQQGPTRMVSAPASQGPVPMMTGTTTHTSTANSASSGSVGMVGGGYQPTSQAMAASSSRMKTGWQSNPGNAPGSGTTASGMAVSTSASMATGNGAAPQPAPFFASQPSTTTGHQQPANAFQAPPFAPQPPAAPTQGQAGGAATTGGAGSLAVPPAPSALPSAPAPPAPAVALGMQAGGGGGAGASQVAAGELIGRVDAKGRPLRRGDRVKSSVKCVSHAPTNESRQWHRDGKAWFQHIPDDDAKRREEVYYLQKVLKRGQEFPPTVVVEGAGQHSNGVLLRMVGGDFPGFTLEYGRNLIVKVPGQRPPQSGGAGGAGGGGGAGGAAGGSSSGAGGSGQAGHGGAAGGGGGQGAVGPHGNSSGASMGQVTSSTGTLNASASSGSTSSSSASVAQAAPPAQPQAGNPPGTSTRIPVYAKDGRKTDIFIDDLVVAHTGKRTPEKWDEALFDMLTHNVVMRDRVQHLSGYRQGRFLLRQGLASPTDHCVVVGPGTAAGWVMVQVWAKGKNCGKAELPGKSVKVVGRAPAMWAAEDGSASTLAGDGGAAGAGGASHGSNSGSNSGSTSNGAAAQGGGGGAGSQAPNSGRGRAAAASGRQGAEECEHR